jgi:hypothetical protein
LVDLPLVFDGRTLSRAKASQLCRDVAAREWNIYTSLADEVNVAKPPSTKIENLPVQDLRLDPHNPRLPEGMDGTVSEKVVEFYWNHYVLDELIDSFIENGYFEQDPMIVMPRKGEYIVLEGNRRLAALIQLLRLPGHIDTATIDQPSQQVRKALAKIPCLVADSRDDVASFLGFKHIGGLKPWSPEAKARFVASEVDRAASDPAVTNPFAHVARMVGTNAQSVRQSYMALQLLRHARKALGIDTAHVVQHRFGVWLRALSAEGVRDKLRLEIPREHADFEGALESVDSKWLSSVVGDLSPSGDMPPILADSRDVTVYGYILNSKRAYSLLKESRDLRVAEQLVGNVALAARIDAVAKRVSALVLDAEQLDGSDLAAYESAKTLSGRAKALANTLRPEAED